MSLVAAERHRWIPECLLLAAVTAATTVVFTATDLDMRLSRVFYDPSAPGGPWPAAARIPWGGLHQVTPWLAAGLGFLGLGLLAGGMIVPARKHWKAAGLLVVLSLALGPGLVVNAIFKDHWRRPRPRQTITLGGDHAYVPPFRMGPAGKSFPCGHCSVGFAYGALSYALRRRRPVAARIWLAASVLAGAVLGYGRVASGGHFASDVVVAAVLTYGTMAIVYYAVLRTPWRETAPQASPAGAPLPARIVRRPLPLRVALVVAAGGLLVFLVLLATPFEQSLGRSVDRGITTGGRWHLVVRVDVGHARLVLEPDGALLASGGSYDGFGFPGGRILESLEVDEQERRLVYSAKPRGWFSDLEGQVILTIAVPGVASVEVEVTDGLVTIDSRLGGMRPPDLSCRIRPDGLRLRGGLRREQVRILSPWDPSEE